MTPKQTLTKYHNDVEFQRLIQLLNISFDLENGPWISGGTARRLWFNEPCLNNDIDLFFNNTESLSSVCSRLNQLQTKDPHYTKNATTYSINIGLGREIKIQTITREFYKNYQEVWQTFDFTSCCFVTDGIKVIADLQAVEDCNSQTLRMIEGTTRGVDGRRVIKYGIYGFQPTRQILKELCQQKQNQTITSAWANEDEYT